MDSSKRKHARVLIDHYLDPSKRWTPSEEREMRQLVREDDSCADYYNRAVTLHRMMVGAEAGQPSGFERERMMNVVVEEASAAPQRSWFAGWLPTLAGAMAGAAALFIVFANPFQTEQTTETLRPGTDGSGEYIAVRSGTHTTAAFALDISGVVERIDASGAEQQLEYSVTDDGVGIEDSLKFYTTQNTKASAYVTVFGLQDDQKPIWFAPHPAMGTDKSLPVDTEMNKPMPIRNPADPKHADGVLFDHQGMGIRLGSLTIVAVFTAEPLRRQDVNALLSKRSMGMAVEPLLRNGLSLAAEAIVQSTSIMVRPGTYSEGLDEK
jgi:hypothetical protein